MEQAKASYRKLVSQYHPDVTGNDPEKTEKFKQVLEAFKTIKAGKAVEEFKVDGFESKRPKEYQGDVRVFQNAVKHYSSFQPLDIEIPKTDRHLGPYVPFFQDKHYTHPKAGTLTILITGVCAASILSMFLFDMRKRDDQVNEILYQKLMREYKAEEWDRTQLHPALAEIKKSPEYQQYLKEKRAKEKRMEGKADQLIPSIYPRYSIKQKKNLDPEADVFN